VDATVERYLAKVRAGLRDMPDPAVEEILLELRGHIAESSKSTGDVGEALASLGDPADLARDYLDDDVIARGECSNMPLGILHSLMLLRRRNHGAGWLVLALATSGYVTAIALAGAAGEKFLSPKIVGFWQPPRALPRIIIDGAAPAGSRELLGWWFVPAAAAVFLVLLFTTSRFGRWWIGRCRRAADDPSQRLTLIRRGGSFGSA
jgi:hypothetical protein